MSACACGQENRPIARFCRHCGSPLELPGGDTVIVEPDALVGLTEIRAEIEEIRAVLHEMKKNRVSPRMNLHIIIIGNSGTGKSLASRLYCDALLAAEALSGAPSYLNAPDLEQLNDRELEKLFGRAGGSAIIIDNAQLLVTDGSPTHRFSKILGEMDRSPLDPVVILTGLPFGFREFLRKEENRHVSGRFKKIFHLPDFDCSSLTEIASHDLTSRDLRLSEEARGKLVRRFMYLVKESRRTDSTVQAGNGHLARKEVEDIIRSYYLRKGEGRTLLPEDIRGEIEKEKSLDEIMGELDSFVGLTEIKREIRSLALQVKVRHERSSEANGIETPVPIHFVITGNPGTGKTSIARVLGEVLQAAGALETGHVVEVDRSLLVAQYVGQTAPRVNETCDRAMGGVLFIDEAYALARGDDGGGDYGREAIETLLKRMEDDRGKFVVVAAGYREEMERFLASNPGLRSRFTHRFEFPDYSPPELFLIFRLIARRNHFRMIEGRAEEKLLKLFENRVARKTKTFANGREARAIFEETDRRHAARVAEQKEQGEFDGGEYAVIRAEDVPDEGMEEGSSIDVLMGELERLVGLERVKAKVREIADTITVSKLRGQEKPVALHFVFTGNPGTGKTTVARLLAEILHRIGVLPDRKLIEVDRSLLVAQYVGQTAPRVNETCDRAMGGVLFIDEAYALIRDEGDPFGREAIDTLLKRMEDDRGKFVVVAAGYREEMERFLASNPGLRSRFTDVVGFDDYTPEELMRIFKRFVKDEGYRITRGLSTMLERAFAEMHLRRGRHFSNGRAARDLFEKIRARQSTRVRGYVTAGMPEETVRSEADILRVEDMDGGGT